MGIGRLRLWWNGMRDGRKNLPPTDALTLSPFEQKLVMIANRGIRETEEEYRRRIDPLVARVHREGDELSRNDEPEFERLVELAGQRRHPEHVIGSGLHAFLLFLLTIGELAFNAQAFAVFGEGTLMNIAMAMAVGVSLPLLAYLVGTDLRQATWTRGRVIGWSVALSVSALALVGINYMRVQFLRGVLQDTEGATDLISSGLEASAAYYVLNLLVFICAAAVSYFHADPVRGFVGAKSRVDARRNKLSEKHGRLSAARAEAEAKAEQIRENTLALINYYRMVNSRSRNEAVPDYFRDPAHASHKPAFAELRLGPKAAESEEPVAAMTEWSASAPA